MRGSIRENVRLYRPGVSDDDVRRALRQVGLERVVEALPEGLETQIHGSSTLFSLEESGRLTLARALAGKPRALVVNGLFDALPPEEREHLLDGALLDESDGRTTILLTSNPRLATRIDRTVELRIPTGGNA